MRPSTRQPSRRWTTYMIVSHGTIVMAMLRGIRTIHERRAIAQPVLDRHDHIDPTTAATGFPGGHRHNQAAALQPMTGKQGASQPFSIAPPLLSSRVFLNISYGTTMEIYVTQT